MQQAFDRIGKRRRPRAHRRAFVCALAALALVFGNAAALHAHTDDHDDCSICAISAGDDGHAPTVTTVVAFAAAPSACAAPVAAPRQRPRTRYRQRAPPPFH